MTLVKFYSEYREVKRKYNVIVRELEVMVPLENSEVLMEGK